MSVKQDDPRLHFLQLSEVTQAPDGLCAHYKNRWWSYDPERGIIFWKPDKHSGHLFPQCNSSEDTARHLTKSLYPWAETKFVPSVFVQANPQDYV